jgi:hypothetical protein
MKNHYALQLSPDAWLMWLGKMMGFIYSLIDIASSPLSIFPSSMPIF